MDEALEREVLGACLDQAPERRRIREAFKNVQLSIDHCLFKVNRYPYFAYLLRIQIKMPFFFWCSRNAVRSFYRFFVRT